MPSAEHMHGGHRSRLRERFIREGLDKFEEHNILELILFYSIPQRDTNELAHSLLNRFGSLEGVFSAQPDELMQMEGVGEHTARFLHLYSDLIEVYLSDRQQNEIIRGNQNIIEFAVRKLAYCGIESLMILFIDNKQSLLSWHLIQEGLVSPEAVDKRSLIRMLMGTQATHVIIAHHYPKGKAKFGKPDQVMIREIAEALRTIGVGIHDYVVVGRDRSYLTVSSSPEAELYRFFLR